MVEPAPEEPLPVDREGSEAASGNEAKIFLGGLSWETTEDTLREHFCKYGEIVEVVVMRNKVTLKPRSFGFVTFETAAAAEKVFAEPQVVDGRQIDCKPSIPRSQTLKNKKKLFVGGLAPTTTEQQFKEYFSQYGKVGECQIMMDHASGRSRGFGFITFSNEEAVQRVFQTGCIHELDGKKIEVKNATPKGSTSYRGTGGRGGRGYTSRSAGGGQGVYNMHMTQANAYHPQGNYLINYAMQGQMANFGGYGMIMSHAGYGMYSFPNAAVANGRTAIFPPGGQPLLAVSDTMPIAMSAHPASLGGPMNALTGPPVGPAVIPPHGGAGSGPGPMVYHSGPSPSQ